MSPVLQRLFTVEGADRLLPEIRPLLEEVVDARHQMGRLMREVHRIHREVHEEGGRPSGDLRERLERGLSRLGELDARVRVLVGQIQRHGVLVKDVDMGLLDFPAVVEGRPAYLCYLLGEESVNHWHLVEEGFNGRRRLGARHRR